jgi:stress response protein YsnF
MAQTVIGIFNDAGAAQGAVQRLTAYGFTDSDIDVSSSGYPAGSSAYADGGDHSDEGFGERVSKFFRNLFEDEKDVQKYSTLARQGTVVSVYTSSHQEAERAADILDEHGAVNVNEQETGYETKTASGSNLSDGLDEKSNRSIPVIEEDVQVGKREVETGGMRLRSRIIERPVEENLRLRTERVTMDRTPANRPATEADLNAFREGEIEVRERAEVPVVNKEARVVEEINVRKDVEEHEEVVRETARKTDVEVENLDSDTDTTGNKSRPRRKI